MWSSSASVPVGLASNARTPPGVRRPRDPPGGRRCVPSEFEDEAPPAHGGTGACVVKESAAVAEPTASIPTGGISRIKDFGRKTDAAKWDESFAEALRLAQSDRAEDHATATEAFNKHCHTENEKHRALELGVVPALFRLLESTDEDAPQTAKITLFGFGYRPGMVAAEVEAQYRANWLDAERVARASAIWHGAFDRVGWDIGKKLMEDEVQGGKMGALTWGETSFDSLAIMLGYVKPRAGERFLDLGAGLGKVVAGAHLLCDFTECVGIELISGLAEAGQKILDDFSPKRIHGGTVALHEGDFLKADWSWADIVFANASMFPKDLLEAIVQKMEAELKDGARVVFITKALKGSRLKQLNARRLYCKHQEEGDTPATFFLYELTPENA